MNDVNINDLIDNSVQNEGLNNNAVDNNEREENGNNLRGGRVVGRGRGDQNAVMWLNEDNFEPEDDEDENDMEDDERVFLNRANIGKGLEGISKQQHMLESSKNLFLPTFGLTKRDFACLNLGKVKEIYQNQAVKRKFEEQIRGVTDYDSLMTWLLAHDTRQQIFKRTRRIKGTSIRKEVPTKVNHEFLIAVALNFGGEEFDNYQDAAYKRKHAKTKKQKQKMPVFLKQDPKYIRPSATNKTSTFTESIANVMDNEIALDKNPLQNELFEHCIVNNYSDFKKFVEKVRSAKLELSGRESALEIVEMLHCKMRMENDSRHSLEVKLRKSLFSERDKIKDELVSVFADLEFEEINPAWFSDFVRDEDLKAFLDYVKSAITRIKNSLNNPQEVAIAREVVGDQIRTYLENRIIR